MPSPPEPRNPLAPLVALFANAVAAELVRRGALAPVDADPWVPHTAWPWSRRVSLARARLGAIVCRRDGRTYYARRSALDAYLDARAVAAPEPAAAVVEVAPPANDAAAGAASVLAEVGLEPRRARGGR